MRSNWIRMSSKSIDQSPYILFVSFFWRHLTACRTSLNPCPLHWKHGALTTRTPGNSWPASLEEEGTLTNTVKEATWRWRQKLEWCSHIATDIWKHQMLGEAKNGLSPKGYLDFGLMILLMNFWPPELWEISIGFLAWFCSILFIYLAASGLSCGSQDLHCVMQDLLLWDTLWHWAQQLKAFGLQ